MKVTNILATRQWFEVLQTTHCCQTAVMILEPNQASGDDAESHEKSTQILLVLEGDLAGEVGNKPVNLGKGDVTVIPPGAKHRFINTSRERTVTFNVYVPPEYAPHTRG